MLPGSPVDAAHALEWVHRLMLEPGRMWRSYVLGNPLFLLRVLRQKLASRGAAAMNTHVDPGSGDRRERHPAPFCDGGRQAMAGLRAVPAPLRIHGPLG